MSHPSIDKYFFWGQVYHGLCVHDVVNLYIYGVFLLYYKYRWAKGNDGEYKGEYESRTKRLQK